MFKDTWQETSAEHAYIVSFSSPGYMPDSASAYATKQEAIAAAIEEKQIALDMGRKVSGNIRRDGFYTVTDPDASENHLGWIISIDDEWIESIDAYNEAW